MKPKLSIAQIVTTVITAIFPFLDLIASEASSASLRLSKEEAVTLNYTIFTWTNYFFLKFLCLVFYITLLLMAVYCVISLFKNYYFFTKKIIIALPSISLVIYCLLIIFCANEAVFVGSGSNVSVYHFHVIPIAYLGIVTIITTIIIECYKQFKCSKEVVNNDVDALTNLDTK